MADAIEVRGLTRRFGRLEAVDNLDLTVPAGSTATVLGTDSRRLGPSQYRSIGYVSENRPA